jgi:hypothetical protein
MEENMNQYEAEFRTSEISLAATLVAFGYPLDFLERTDSSKVFFVFKRDSQLDEIIQRFWSRNLTVEPLTLFESQRYLKSRIFGER